MRISLRAAALALCLGAFAGSAFAQAGAAWPNKPVRIVVPFAPGGTTDILARALAPELGKAFGQSFIVENKPGAGGNTGADLVAKSPPDGYTLLMASGSILTANPFMYKSLPFDATRDFVPITNVASGPQVVAVGASSPFKDLREFIAYAKAHPKEVTFGSAGVGTQTHLATENFAYTANIDMVHVPYKGETYAMTDLMGGQIQMVTPNLGAAINLIKEGKLRALAVTSRERMPQLPDVPAAAESLPGFENAGWFGLLAPAGTPKEIVDKVQRDSDKVLHSEDFRAKLAQQGMVPVGNTPAEFAAAIRDESARWAKVIKERGLVAH